MDTLRETSIAIDLVNLAPLLRWVSPLIHAGFGEPEIAEVVALAERLEIGDEENLVFDILMHGPEELHVAIVKDDVDAITLYLMATFGLSSAIEFKINEFITGKS